MSSILAETPHCPDQSQKSCSKATLDVPSSLAFLRPSHHQGLGLPDALAAVGTKGPPNPCSAVRDFSPLPLYVHCSHKCDEGSQEALTVPRDHGPTRPSQCLPSVQNSFRSREYGDCFSMSPTVARPAGSCVRAEAAGRAQACLGTEVSRELREHWCRKQWRGQPGSGSWDGPSHLALRRAQNNPAHRLLLLSFQPRPWEGSVLLNRGGGGF